VAPSLSLDRSILDRGPAHRRRSCFIAFAVRGTAPDPMTIDASCIGNVARPRRWLVFEVEANRFLHHMVRFLVGTLIEAASGKQSGCGRMPARGANDDVSPPAPPHGLFLDRVTYPPELYLQNE
jgi:tRNA pseudouridine38-40 synthase